MIIVIITVGIYFEYPRLYQAIDLALPRVPAFLTGCICGKFVYEKLSVKEIRDYSMKEKARLWDEIFRLEFPHNYYVDLSKKLLDYKIKMLEEKRK